MRIAPSLASDTELVCAPPPPPPTAATPVAGDALPFADSLCHACAKLRHVRTATSTYLLCTALATKYPRQPVVACPAFSARSDGR